MERYVILVETTPELWENIRTENKRHGKQIEVHQSIVRPLAKRGFAFQEYDYMFAANVLLDQAKNILSHEGSRETRFQLKDFWDTVKNNFYPFRQVDAMLNTDRQVLVFYTVYDIRDVDDYVDKAVRYRQQMGYNDKVYVCRIRLSHDGTEKLDKWYDYLITCSGDWDFMLKDIELAMEDYIEHDIFLEPRNSKPKQQKDDLSEVVESTSWYVQCNDNKSDTSTFNPFYPNIDWKQYEFPKPKIGDLMWTTYEFSI